MDYLVLWGGRQKGKQKLYRTGNRAEHASVVARLKAGVVVHWPVEEAAAGKAKTVEEPEKKC